MSLTRSTRDGAWPAWCILRLVPALQGLDKHRWEIDGDTIGPISPFTIGPISPFLLEPHLRRHGCGGQTCRQTPACQDTPTTPRARTVQAPHRHSHQPVGHPHNQLPTREDRVTPGGASPGPTAHGAEASQAPSEPPRTHLRLTVTASDDAFDTVCRPGRARAAARTTHGLAPPPPRASLQQANRRQAK